MRKSAAVALLFAVVPALVVAQGADGSQCLLDLQVGRYCVIESLARTAIACAAVIAIALIWRFLRDQFGMREWQEEVSRGESRLASLGDLSAQAIADPEGTAQLLRDRIGFGAADYVRQQRSQAFKAGDIETAAAWQKVERYFDRRIGG